MSLLEFRRLQLSSFAVALLAGCSASPLPTSQPGYQHSWMGGEATTGDLMYVADTKDAKVDVYTYPDGKAAGALTGFEGLSFMCVDGEGHIFIPDYGRSEIFEYAHGGTKPIRSLTDGKAAPYGCAVNPKNGDLAVANFSIEGGGAAGDVLVYAHARQETKSYDLGDIEHPYFCAYDDAGNLFVEGSVPASFPGPSALEELAKGATLFRNVTLENIPAYMNGLQWTGNYLAMGTGTIAGPSSGDTYVYHVQISDLSAKTIGTTQVKENGPTANFYVDGSTIVVAGGETQAGIGFFHYPAGGNPFRTLAQTSPYGVVVSAARTTAPASLRHLADGATSKYQYRTLYTFQGFDGASPAGSLLYFNGKLFGTTQAGGYYSGGTVFEATLAGKVTVLHHFGQSGDGSKPEAGLTALDGVLYGTTYSGGAYGGGTVFSITAGGQERVLSSLGGTSADAANPMAGLTPVNGLLYGTTAFGGDYNAGTVFTVTTAGKERVLYRFPPYSKADGENPEAGLTLYNGILYGTTEISGPCEEGTVFSITTSGKESTIYGFPCQRYDGSNPAAGITVLDGVLYGAAVYGGKAFSNTGAVFSVTKSGGEKVVFDFYPPSEYGAGPNTTLTLAKGAFYGTTPSEAANGAGSVYKVTPSGAATVVHSFGIPPDGAVPLAGLIDVRGTLYGTTSGGGVGNAGTIYRFTP